MQLAIQLAPGTNQPSCVEVCFVMSKFFFLRFMVHQSQDGYKQELQHEPIWQTMINGLHTNHIKYCQQLAKVVVHLNHESVEGMMLLCQLPSFLSAFSEHSLPSNMSDIFMLVDLGQRLTAIFMKATTFLMNYGNHDGVAISHQHQESLSETVSSNSMNNDQCSNKRKMIAISDASGKSVVWISYCRCSNSTLPQKIFP